MLRPNWLDTLKQAGGLSAAPEPLLRQGRTFAQQTEPPFSKFA